MTAPDSLWTALGVEHLIFALTLAGVALLHKRALAVALAGLAAMLLYTVFAGTLADGIVGHLRHEWVIITNLLLLLVGFELLANHFEKSNLPEHLPSRLPGNWTGGLALLGLVFVLSAFLDNIAAAVIGGVVARHVYRGRVSVGYIAAIVAAANAGGAGSVIGDTTTTLMWLKGHSPAAMLPAFIGAVPALLVFGVAAAFSQHRFQPIEVHDAPGFPLQWRRIGIVAFVLVCAVAANISSTVLSPGEELAPWLGLAVWAALLASAPLAAPDWKLVTPALKGALFLCALVLSASLVPVAGLPTPTALSTFGLGALSALFDNIPLTALALKQGGYDWPLLAYAVGFGGSMLWFGSSAGVAVTNLYPEARSVVRWVREAWFVPLAYVAGFVVMALTR